MASFVRMPLSLLFGLLVSAALFLGLSNLVDNPVDVLRPVIVAPVAPPPPVAPRTVIDVVPPLPQPRFTDPIDIPGERIVIDLEPVPPATREPLRPFDRHGVFGEQTVGPMTIGEDRSPRLSYGIDPIYPPSLEARGVEGWVRVRFNITATGRVVAAHVVAAEPAGAFDRAALDAVMRRRYEPGISNGIAVESPAMEVVLRFSLP